MRFAEASVLRMLDFVDTVADAMNGVFLRKRSKLSDAIWSMVEKVRASFMADDCWRRRRGGGGGREGRRPAVCLAYASEWTRLRKVGSALSVEPEPCNRLNT